VFRRRKGVLGRQPRRAAPWGARRTYDRPTARQRLGLATRLILSKPTGSVEAHRFFWSLALAKMLATIIQSLRDARLQISPKTVLVELSVQRGASDTQAFRGVGQVAARLCQGSFDRRAFA
jgi:hypothetical protein